MRHQVDGAYPRRIGHADPGVQRRAREFQRASRREVVVGGGRLTEQVGARVLRLDRADEGAGDDEGERERSNHGLGLSSRVSVTVSPALMSTVREMVS